jgi:hypothetical protein
VKVTEIDHGRYVNFRHFHFGSDPFAPLIGKHFKERKMCGVDYCLPVAAKSFAKSTGLGAMTPVSGLVGCPRLSLFLHSASMGYFV